MKKRRQVTYLSDIVQELSADSDIPLSESSIEFVIGKFIDKAKSVMLNEGVVDIHGTRFRINERKLNPMCGKDRTYKISADISDELRDQAEKKFSVDSE